MHDIAMRYGFDVDRLAYETSSYERERIFQYFITHFDEYAQEIKKAFNTYGYIIIRYFLMVYLYPSVLRPNPDDEDTVLVKVIDAAFRDIAYPELRAQFYDAVIASNHESVDVDKTAEARFQQTYKAAKADVEAIKELVRSRLRDVKATMEVEDTTD
jgi:hypothetical protein